MYREHVVLPDGYSLEVFFASPANYRLAFRKRRRVLVEYSDRIPYGFKSVEKLRYDFERDVEDAKRKG